MEYIKLDRKAITSWRIGRTISFVIIALVCGLAFLGISFIPDIEGFRWMLYGLVGLFALYKFVGIFVYPLIEYRQWGYLITEDKVDIRHGIFFVTNTVIPVIRIQHITINQGPINRKLGLYNVEISLASGNFQIECLNKGVADAIVENLKNKLYVRLEVNEEGKI